jgi:hypothetical protein
VAWRSPGPVEDPDAALTEVLARVAARGADD